MNLNYINSYDIVGSPSFRDASFRKDNNIDKFVIDYFARTWIGIDFVINRKFRDNINGKNMYSYIVSQLLYEVEHKDTNKLDVLFICDNLRKIYQYKIDIFDEFSRRNYKISIKNNNILIGENIVIEFVIDAGHLIGRDLPDLVIHDSYNGIKGFIDRYDCILHQERRSGRKMVKLVGYIEDKEIELSGISGYEYYDLNNISNELYKQTIREQKLKRILGSK